MIPRPASREETRQTRKFQASMPFSGSPATPRGDFRGQSFETQVLTPPRSAMNPTPFESDKPVRLRLAAQDPPRAVIREGKPTWVREKGVVSAGPRSGNRAVFADWPTRRRATRQARRLSPADAGNSESGWTAVPGLSPDVAPDVVVLRIS